MADVVLVNPTHVAVALRYDPQQGRAAGRRQGRRRGRRQDPRAGRPSTGSRWSQDVPLARALHAALRGRPGDPAELFQARSPRCSRSCMQPAAPRGSAAGLHRSPRTRPRLTARTRAGALQSGRSACLRCGRRRRSAADVSAQRAPGRCHDSHDAMTASHAATDRPRPGGRRDGACRAQPAGVPDRRRRHHRACWSCRCPPFLLDLLIAFNITGALLVLLVACSCSGRWTSRSSPRCCWSPPCSGSRSTSAPPGWCCATATPAR